MSQSTKLYAGVIVLAALGGAIYYAKDKDSKIGSSSTTSAELPELKAPEELDKVSITNGDKGEIVLEKKGDKWVMTKPVEAPANQGNIDQLVKNLKDLKAKEVIVSTASEDSKKDYDFVADKGVHVVAFKGGDKKVDLTFGSSGQRGQMAMVDGKPGIYAVTGYSSYLYTREPKGFRETEIFKYDDQNANGLVIEKKDGQLSFTKEGDKWSGTWKGRPIERFDEEKAKDAVRAFKALTADDFGDGKTTAETGLDAPDSTVTVQLKDNAGKFVVKVGSVSTGTNRWAVKEGSDTIYSIPSYSADWATADVSKFQKSADGGAGDAPKKLDMPGMPGMPGMPHGMPPGMGHGPDDGHGH
ncbi:MAG: DUF4340 domain-containing protein [Labilithrix sp.]|nr:DUF4340 domain-containing protein [Labilithrix sp.]